METGNCESVVVVVVFCVLLDISKLHWFEIVAIISMFESWVIICSLVGSGCVRESAVLISDDIFTIIPCVFGFPFELSSTVVGFWYSISC